MSDTHEGSASGRDRASSASQGAGGARVVEPRARGLIGGSNSGSASRDPAHARNGRVSPAEREHLKQALATLTPRELDVVEAVWQGGSNEAVAERMCVAIPTLRTHLMRIHRKLGTRGKGELIRFVAEQMLDGYRAGRLKGRGGGGAALLPASEENAKSSLSMMTAAAESSQ